MPEPRNTSESGVWLRDLNADVESRIDPLSSGAASTPNDVLPPDTDVVADGAQSCPTPDSPTWLLLPSTEPRASQTVSHSSAATNPPRPSVDSSADTIRAQGHGRMLGDYELLEEIARGSVGVVYRARQVSLSRIVAVKVIQSGRLASAEEVRKFHAEAEAAASLHHPHIVPIYETGSVQGVHFFSMRYIEGGSLAEHKGRLQGKWRQIARLMATIAHAVHYAHRHGVLHRDLKPANILLDADGQPCVSDFGLCKRFTELGENQQGMLIGTPLYMAPEQVDDRLGSVSVASDVYSLGAILYELITGEPPVNGDSVAEVLSKLVRDTPVRPRQLRNDVPRDLEAICLKCLQKSPKERYASAEDLAEDLERFLNGEPIRARRVGMWERLWRWICRNPGTALLTLSAALVGTVAVLVILVVAVLVAWREAEAAKHLQALHREAVSAKEQAENQRQRTLAILRDTELQQRQAQRQAAELAWHEAIQACNAYQMDEALLWLAGTLSLLPGPYQAEQEAIRTMLACWQAWTHRLIFYGRLPERWRSVACHPKELVVLGVSLLDQAYRWDLMKQAQPQRLGPNTTPVRDIRFLAQGEAILAIGRQGWQIWDAQGQQVLDEWRGESLLRSWAVGHDGEVWAVADRDQNVFLWTWQSKVPAPHPAQLLARWRLPKPVDMLAIASRTKTVVARTQAGTWVLNIGDSMISRPPDLNTSPTCLAISSEGGRLLMGSYSALVHVRDMNQKWPRIPSLTMSSIPRSALVSEDGKWAVALGQDGTLYSWDVEALQIAGHPIGSHVPISACDLSPDGQRLAAIGEDRSLRVWKSCFQDRWHRHPRVAENVRLAAFSGDGRFLAVAAEGLITLYAREGTAFRNKMAELELIATPMYLALNEDGSRLLVATTDGRLNVWNTRGGVQLRMSGVYGERMSLVAWDAAGNYLAATGGGRYLVLWDLQHRCQLGPRRALSSTPTALAINGNGTHWAVGLESGVVCLGQMARPEQPPVAWPAHASSVTALQFASNSGPLFSAGNDGSVFAWETSKSRLLRTFSQHAGLVKLLSISPDGSGVFSAGTDYTGALHQLAQGESRFLKRPTRQECIGASYAPSGKWLATANALPSVEVWHVPSGFRLTPPLVAPAPIRACHWVDDNELVILCQDGQVLSWRVPQPLSQDADTLAAQVQEQTGLQLVGNTIRPISVEKWQQLRWQKFSTEK